MAGLRACAPVKTKGGQPYNRPRKPAKFRELGESDDELDMNPRDKSLAGSTKDIVPMPPGQSRIGIKSAGSKPSSTIMLPDDMIPSPTFLRPGETMGRKKGKQVVSKCKCCERELTKVDRDKSLLSKYVKCTTCKGNVCELCRDRENRCHECYVEKSVSLDPTALMEFQRETLLRFLEILHYNESDFAEFDKAHLVKQLLSRFRVHELWDPRFHADPLEIEELKKKKEEAMRQQEEEEEEEEEEEDDYPRQTSLHKYPKQKATSIDNILELGYESPAQVPSHRMDKDIRVGTPKKYQEVTKQGRQGAPYAAAGPLLLQNISSPKQLEDLEVYQLKAILDHYGEDSNGERPVLKYRVLQLWNSVVSKGQQERNTPSPKFVSNPGSAGLQKTFSLMDISSSSAIERLTTTQLKNLMRKHNQDPDLYSHRSDLEYQVTLLWNNAKRDTLGIVKEKTNPARNWKSQENVHSPAYKWSSAAQAVQPVKDKAGPRQYGGGRHEPEKWGVVNRYDQSPENNRREIQRNPYQEPIHTSSTLPRNRPVNYNPEPLPSSPMTKRPSPPQPPPLPPPAPHLLKSLSLHDINKPEEILQLSMKQLIGLLDDHAINTDGASDKAHLVDLLKQLWFEKIMPERSLGGQQRVQGRTYQQHPQNSPPSAYPGTYTGFENQFGAMSIGNQQKYSDGDNSSMSSMTQKSYFNQETTNVPYKPYGNILPQERGSPGVGAIKKPSQEMCTVCLARPIDCIILNCGHMVSCMVCVSRMDACPLCHSEIIKLINIK